MDPTIHKFIQDQLSVWPLAAKNFRALKSVRVRKLEVEGLSVVIQNNPDRIVSSTAKIDAASIAARPCFLCLENEVPEQMHLVHEGRKGRRYNIQINPYPIFPRHLVICADHHTPQSIWHRFVDMLDLAKRYPEYTIFYNGPRSGASAPDHLHFQAVPRKIMPLEKAIDAHLDLRSSSEAMDFLTNVQDAALFHYRRYANGIFAIRAKTSKSMAKMFYRLLDCAPTIPGDTEPRFNLYCWHKAGEYRAMVIFRTRHCSSHFSSDDPARHLTMSPGCADMAGYFIAPVAEDYEKLTSDLLRQMLEEVTINDNTEMEIIDKLTRSQKKIAVGIMSAPEIEFEIISDGAGRQKVFLRDGKIDLNGTLYDELWFDAQTMSTMFAEPSFILFDVPIGIQFHWYRKFDQKFAGALHFIVEGDKITAINNVGVEEYLLSVISSEMKSSASLELLKAHAVISRSWIMKMLERHAAKKAGIKPTEHPNDWVVGEDGIPTLITWFDQEDHVNFDVCADDHCQRYQGLTMAIGENVRKAIDATWGEVLKYGGELCDARFYKCCGGKTETFETCWEDVNHPYLTVVEEDFCDTTDESILSQVLNDYDLETKDFHHWTVRYGRKELSELFARRSGKDVGEIISLEPLQRGPGDHICKLKVTGTKGSVIIGKELIIRKFLSESHLKSSNFEVEYTGSEIILNGKAWGHGAGLCQIGAAVMGARGYSYKTILSHYYPGTTTEKI